MRVRDSAFLFPAHTPELNPDEQVWNEIKHRRIGRQPVKNKLDLKRRLDNALRALQAFPERMRFFFQLPDTQGDAMNDSTNHQKYLRMVDTIVGVRGKKVLEVGGCSPVELLNKFGPNSWTCINMDDYSVREFNKQAERLNKKYSAIFSDINSFDMNDCYDLTYSINAFEHIHDLENAIERMYQATRWGGYLFALFGPIWSSDVGHHLSIPTEDGKGLHFYEGVLFPWEHLTSQPEEIGLRLEKLYGTATAEKAITYIYSYPDLNRLSEHNYLSIFKECSFNTVILVRNRSGVPPKVPYATNTREILIILKKGRVGSFEKLIVLLKCALAYLSDRVL